MPQPGEDHQREEQSLPHRARKLLASEITEMIDCYRQGSTVTQLATRYAIDRETVRRVIRQTGLPPHPRGLTARQIDEAVHLYEAGQSLARIGDRYDVTAGTVRRRLIERGITMRPTSTPAGRSQPR